MFLTKIIVFFACIFVSFDFGNCGGTPALVSEFVYITYAGKRNFEGIAKCLNEKPLRQDATVSIWEWDPISDDFLAEQKIYNNKIDEVSARFKLSFFDIDPYPIEGGVALLQLYLKFENICDPDHIAWGNPQFIDAYGKNYTYHIYTDNKAH